MALGHPVDALGRVLPDSAWPSDKAAPDRWDLIRRLCNTTNRENGADRLETEEGVRGWLDTEGIDGTMPSPNDRARLMHFRELLRDHALAHHDTTDVGGLDAALAEQVASVDVGLAVRDGRLDVVPTATGVVDGIIGRAALAIMGAQREDCWRRFKACRHCEWVFYDRSKNQSGRWCSMNACGGRAKVAAFREREKGST